MITADRPEGTTESLTRPNTAAMSPSRSLSFRRGGRQSPCQNAT